MVSWVIAVVATTLGIGFALFLVGLTLPRWHSAKIFLRIEFPRDRVWTIVTDADERALWRSDVRLWSSLAPREGDAVWRETDSKANVITFRASESRPPEFWKTEIVDNPVFGGAWEYTLIERGAATELQIVENGEIFNPLYRTIFRLAGAPDRSLQKIGRLLRDHCDRIAKT